MKLLIELGADVNAADKYGSTVLHVMAACLKNSIREDEDFDDEVNDDEEDDGNYERHTSDVELSQEDWCDWPVYLGTNNASLTKDLIRYVVSMGGNVQAVNSKGHTPLSLVRDTALKSDIVFLTRRPLLHFFEAICIAEGLEGSRALQRVAENFDVMGHIVTFL